MILNNSINALTNNNKKYGKAIEKLSTGLAINRSADNSAGLAISEKMRAQIRGLSQAQKNTQDSISLIQVADGAMNEVVGILNRVRELTVQGANDTNVSQERDAIQGEINELLKEVDRISEDTEFNSIPLLNGRYNNTFIGNMDGIDKYVQSITSSGGINDKYSFTGIDGSGSLVTEQYASAIIDFSNLNSIDDVEKLDGKGVNYTCCSCNKAYSIKFVKGNPDNSRLNAINPVMEVDITGISNGTDLVKKVMKEAYGENNYEFNPKVPNLPTSATSFVKHFSKLASDGSKLYIYDERSYEANSTWPKKEMGKFEFGVYGEPILNPDSVAVLNFQVGANMGEKLEVELPIITLQKLGLDNSSVDVSNYNKSSISIKVIDGAIEHVNSERGRLGAYQNRLDYTLNNSSNSEENLQASEGRIRDADIAKGVMEVAKCNILSQSSQAILVQSNEMNKSILNLFQSFK